MGTRLAGQTLAGRYDLIELLGAGGMGEVYRARDRELDELVALKVIRADLASAPEVVARFRHEVKLARRVTHGNIARTFELGQADGLMFCTMQMIDGESLAHRLARERRIAVPEAVAIACALCEGLSAAHAADVIHRDIKPANVLLARDGRAVLADFGIAAVRIADDAGISGTPAYMAPEQARGEPPTPAADVYAVGALLHEMVTGRRAFAGDPVAIFDAKQQVERLTVTPHDDVPRELGEVIGRATARELADRFGTAAELGHALAPWRRTVVPAPRPIPRRTADAFHERTVLVVAPRAAADGPLVPIAEAIHEELLGVLARGRLRRTLPSFSRNAQVCDLSKYNPLGAAMIFSLRADETRMLFSSVLFSFLKPPVTTFKTTPAAINMEIKTIQSRDTFGPSSRITVKSLFIKAFAPVVFSMLARSA
jgi:serine/threonine protein kinase